MIKQMNCRFKLDVRGEVEALSPDKRTLRNFSPWFDVDESV